MSASFIASLALQASLAGAPEPDGRLALATPAAVDETQATESTAQTPSTAEPTQAPPQPAPTTKPESPAQRSRLLPPSFVFGDTARIDLRVKLHVDQRTFHPDPRHHDLFDLRRARIGVEGTLKDNVVEYEVEYDFREEDYPLRDAFVDVRVRRALQIRAGKFKLPFSRDELTGAMALDFAFRSRAADQLAPGRSFGGMVHGRVLDRRLQFQAGLFREDGENARPAPVRLGDESENTIVLSEGAWSTTSTWAARTTVEVTKGLELGAAMTAGDVPEGRNGLRGQMIVGGDFFPRLEVNGRRQRLGLEAVYEADAGSITAEWIRVQDQRLGQGFANEDLDPVTAHGWYIAGAWLAFGRKPSGNADRPESRRGAIEFVARFEGLRFGGPTEGSDPTRSPRAAVIVANGERVWTFGANWYAHRFIRVLGNVVREQLDDAVRAPVPGRPTYWSALARFQFVL
jgi:phosphate-selective porin